jgi:hypothetical protein
MDQRFNKGKEQFRDRREDQNQGRQFFFIDCYRRKALATPGVIGS